MALLSIFGPTVAKSIDGVKDSLVNAVKGELKEQFDKYGPQLLEYGKEQWEKYGPQIMDLAKTEFHDLFEQWMPILMTGMSKSVTTSIVKVGQEGGSIDKLTDMTPTDIDDRIVDPVAKELFEWLGTVFSGVLPPGPR